MSEITTAVKEMQVSITALRSELRDISSDNISLVCDISPPNRLMKEASRYEKSYLVFQQ